MPNTMLQRCVCICGLLHISETKNGPATGNGIKNCGNSLFCCFGRRDCDCDDEEQVFSMEPIRIVASISTDRSQTTRTTSTGDVITTSRISTAETSSTTTTSPAANATAGLVGDPPSEQGDNSLTFGLGVGLGVGVPLVAIAAALAWFFWRKRAKSQLVAEMSQNSSLQGDTAALYGLYAPVKPQLIVSTELDSRSRPTELAAPDGGSRVQYELP